MCRRLLSRRLLMGWSAVLLPGRRLKLTWGAFAAQKLTVVKCRFGHKPPLAGRSLARRLDLQHRTRERPDGATVPGQEETHALQHDA